MSYESTSEIMSAAVRLVTQSRHRGPDDVDRARTCLLHFMGCAINGRSLPWSRAAVEVARQSRVGDSARGASVVGEDEFVTVDAAVFANAVLGQSTLAEDVDPASLVHPGSMIMSASLAAAERRDATEQDLLRGIIAGYDVVCSIGTSMKTPEFVRRGLRPSGIFGPFGAAAAVASVWRFSDELTAACLGIAGNTGAGLREWATAGTTDIYFQNGIAARNGYLAAVLAEQGMTGPDTVLEGPSGLTHAVSGGQADWGVLLGMQGAPAAVQGIQFKRYPACSAVQTVLEVAVTLMRRTPIDSGLISHVEVVTHAHGKHNPGCDSVGPWQHAGQAQMSNQLGVAIALTGRPLTVTAYAEAMDDPGVCELARRVSVVEDPAMTAEYPARSEGLIRVHLTDGRTIEESSAVAIPLTDAEARDVFRSAVTESLPSAEEVGHALSLLENPDPNRPVREWARVLRAVRP